MKKIQVSPREFFNKVIEANAIIAEDGLIPTVRGYFAIVNVPHEEAALREFLSKVYGNEAESIIPPESGWYFILKDTKDGEEAFPLKSYRETVENRFRQKQEDYQDALARKAEIAFWKAKRQAEVE